MSPFAGLLKKSIPDAEAQIDRVYQDLQEIITGVNQAIREDAGGLAVLVLDELCESQGGDCRLLIKDTMGIWAEGRAIVDFKFGETGYPIQVLAPASSIVLDTIQDKGALVRYFSQMLAALSSPIVVFLAFVKRHQQGARL